MLLKMWFFLNIKQKGSQTITTVIIFKKLLLTSNQQGLFVFIENERKRQLTSADIRYHFSLKDAGGYPSLTEEDKNYS